MKIALVIYGSLDTLSGGYLYDRQLVAHLRANGCHVDIWSLPWRNYAGHLSDNFRLSWALNLARGGYDVILQDELNHPSLWILNHLVKRHCHCPIVSIVHHLRSSEEHPHTVMPLYQWIERKYLRSVDAFIYNSITTRATVEGILSYRAPHAVAYPAADHIQPPPHDQIMQSIAQRSRSNKPLQLLFIGNIIARKGLHTVLDSLARLKTGRWHLHIVGSQQVDSAYSQAMQERASAYTLTSRLTWHGRVSDQRLTDLLATSDLLVMPSYEGFGIVFLEAMGYGLPIIAANTGAAPEIISSAINGYLVSRGDSDQLAGYIKLLLHNRLQLATIAYHARLRYEEHPTWSESMNAALNWLHEITH